MSDPPFEQCTTRPQVNVDMPENIDKVFPQYFPSSAKYTISGEASISKLIKTLDPKQGLSISILQDIDQDDTIRLDSDDSSRFFGRLLTDALKKQGVDFEINDIETECEYTAIAEFKSGTNSGSLNELINNRNSDKQGNALFIYDNRVLADPKDATKPATVNGVPAMTVTPSNALSLNPPLRHCGTASEAAIYEIRGTPDLMKLKNLDGKQDLDIILTADLIPTEKDRLKIYGTNTVYFEVLLVIDSGNKNSQVIEFPLEQITTNCKEVAFSDAPVSLGSENS
jgi:hypothetical protein